MTQDFPPDTASRAVRASSEDAGPDRRDPSGPASTGEAWAGGLAASGPGGGSGLGPDPGCGCGAGPGCRASGAPDHAPAPRSGLGRLTAPSLAKSLAISLRGIEARLGRCLVTLAALVLAVAFLAFTLAGNDLVRGLLASGRPGFLSELARAGYSMVPGPEPGTFVPAVDAKERWLVGLSLLVCAVGVVNAQLMAVTERFREIGTMKCLGALDSFVLRLFLLEALIQGLAGAAAGAVAGVAAAFGVGIWRFGASVLVLADWPGVAASVGACLAAGVGLSLAGVVYPALAASRMPPVVAMRAEE